MFKTLLKSRFDAFWASFSGTGASKKKSQSMATKVLLLCLFAFLVLYLVGAFALMSFGMDTLAKETGDYWVSLTVTSLVATGLCVIGSVFTAKTQIFESKDNELLLSMPIEPKYIFLSRITMLLIVNYALESIVMIPSIVVHAIVIGYGALEAIFTLLVFLMLPFFTLALSTMLAWVISIISSKIRNKTLVSVLFTVVFLVLYFGICGAFGGFVGAGMGGEESGVDMSGLKNTYLFYWMGSAMGEGNALHFLYFAICTIIPASVAYLLLNHSFIKIITTNKGVKKIVYKAKEEKANSQFIALYKKELRRFFSSSAYILNAGMGNIMTIIVAVMAAILSGELMPLIAEEPVFAIMVPTFVAMILIFMASMNLVSAPSISLEDKNLWILQSAPINPRSILLAKILTHMTICTPCTVISVIIASIAFRISVLNVIMMLLSTTAIIAFTGYFGLFLGLKFPKFDWQNETVAVKQGFAVFGTMFGSMIWTMLFFFVAILLAVLGIEFWVMGIIFTIANLTVCGILHVYFVKGGSNRFANLKH